MKVKGLNAISKPITFGKNMFQKTVFSLGTRKTTFGKWETKDPVDLVQKFMLTFALMKKSKKCLEQNLSIKITRK